MCCNRIESFYLLTHRMGNKSESVCILRKGRRRGDGNRHFCACVRQERHDHSQTRRPGPFRLPRTRMQQDSHGTKRTRSGTAYHRAVRRNRPQVEAALQMDELHHVSPERQRWITDTSYVRLGSDADTTVDQSLKVHSRLVKGGFEDEKLSTSSSEEWLASSTEESIRAGKSRIQWLKREVIRDLPPTHNLNDCEPPNGSTEILEEAPLNSEHKKKIVQEEFDKRDRKQENQKTGRRAD